MSLSRNQRMMRMVAANRRQTAEAREREIGEWRQAVKENSDRLTAVPWSAPKPDFNKLAIMLAESYKGEEGASD
jgi:hypothetical protein